jgi:F-type H+-transporting ATPase subunit gamma
VAANIKEIGKRIRSVRNTQQITRAMKMVAAAKLRRTHDRLLASRPYGRKLGELLAGLAAARIDHPFFEARELKCRLVLVVSSDKGLCGSYNANLLRLAHNLLQEEFHQEGVENLIYCIGRKANDYFRRRKMNIHAAVGDLGGMIDIDRIHAVADEIMEMYLAGQVDEVVIVYTRFKSTLSYEPKHVQLLPLKANGAETDQANGPATDYIYEPDAATVLQMLLPKSVSNQVFNCVAEAFTSEHGARMTSMGSATDNAGDLIDQLVLFRNRARQAAITQEISEIVGGADAIS